jgi:hypothetical protein
MYMGASHGLAWSQELLLCTEGKGSPSLSLLLLHAIQATRPKDLHATSRGFTALLKTRKESTVEESACHSIRASKKDHWSTFEIVCNTKRMQD